jgi:hypothetical protein
MVIYCEACTKRPATKKLTKRKIGSFFLCDCCLDRRRKEQGKYAEGWNIEEVKVEK